MAEGWSETIGLLQQEYKEKEQINIHFCHQTRFYIKAIDLQDFIEEETILSNFRLINITKQGGLGSESQSFFHKGKSHLPMMAIP